MLQQTTLNFLESVTQLIPGWMNPYAGRVTAELLQHQHEIGVRGAMFEIGVYAGKYLSVLYENARATRANLLAIDPYQHFAPEQVARHLNTTVKDSTVRFLTHYSTDLNAADLRDLLGEKCRFVSLDGSHFAADVAWDLQLAYANLGPQGIIGVDDFINTECLGVVEAVSEFLSRKPNLAPFLLTSNKLFLAPLRAVDSYKAFVLGFARSAPDEGGNRLFVERHDQNPVWASSQFHGHWLYVI